MTAHDTNVKNRPPTLCAYPRCPNPAIGAYCKEHGPNPDQPTKKPRPFDRKRQHSRARGYTRAYERLRSIRVQRNPICQAPGCRRLTEEVDHIVPLAIGGTNMLSNLQSLCIEHHRAKSKRDRAEIAALRSPARDS